MDTKTFSLRPQPNPRPRKFWNALALALVLGLLYQWTWIFARVSNVDHEFDWFSIKPSEEIKWTSCFGEQKCARLSLPLDYLTPEGPKAVIALRMIPATDKRNYKGSVLINPGGPGGSGTEWVRRRGEDISKIIGSEFDILGFDPRGTGATTPHSRCFDTESQSKIWGLQDGILLNLTDDSIPLAKSRQRLIGERCLEAIGGDGKEDLNGTAESWGPGRFMTTASVATDMLRIVEKLGQDKLQYWGFSYGTVLGQYFAAMYPDKVGRLIIDGVYDATDYRRAQWYSNLVDTDAVIDSLHDFCFKAGPSKCGLYAPTVDKIRDRVSNIINSLAKSPTPLPFASNGPVVLTKRMFHQLAFSATYSPLLMFPYLVDGLVAIERQNTTALASLVDTLLISESFQCNCKEPSPWTASNEALNAIACGDGEKNSDSPEEYEDFFSKLTAMSHFAAPLWGVNYLRCSQWKISAKWRYTGPFSGNTSYPLLIISPTFDPVCPLKDAKQVKERYVGAKLLVQDSYGHCSISSPSICTAKTIRAYFADGTLPEDGHVCQVEALPLVGQVDSARVLSSDDEELLTALKSLSSEVPRFGNF